MPLFRHAGLEEPAPYKIRGHPGVVPTPYQVRGKLQSGTISKTGSRFSPGTLDSGFRRNDKNTPSLLVTPAKAGVQ